MPSIPARVGHISVLGRLMIYVVHLQHTGMSTNQILSTPGPAMLQLHASV